ncbi:hypothetical protein NMY22_g9741 [Coprinellus aureogranulatus]|nr:hypothetical protein NMY22_g9741 [Coprinellus aureogranulatus]
MGGMEGDWGGAGGGNNVDDNNGGGGGNNGGGNGGGVRTTTRELNPGGVTFDRRAFVPVETVVATPVFRWMREGSLKASSDVEAKPWPSPSLAFATPTPQPSPPILIGFTDDTEDPIADDEEGEREQDWIIIDIPKSLWPTSIPTRSFSGVSAEETMYRGEGEEVLRCQGEVR